jgi:hypothetical protein
MSGRATMAGAALVVLALLLGACSADDATVGDLTADDDVDAAEGFDEGAPADRAEDQRAEGGDDGDLGEDEASAVPVAGSSAGRRVIRTAELVLEVEDPAGAAAEVVAIATDAGGFVATTDLMRDAEGVVRGTIVLRVPSDQLLPTVAALDALAAAVPVNRIDEVDVTAEATDLQARLTNLTRYEQELSELLGDVRETTTRPDDLLTVFERIRSVRQEIDSLAARLAVLDDQVALATVTVELQPTAAAMPVGDPSWSPGDTVRAALTSLARTLAGLADAAIWLTVAVLPVLLLVAVPLLVGWSGWRAYRRRHPRPGHPPPPSWPATPPPGSTAPTSPAATSPADGAPRPEER